MFGKNTGGILILIVIAILSLMFIFREHLTGNAPVELPLPKYLKHSEPSGPVKNPERLDTREIPTGYDYTDTSYELQPGVMNKLESEQHKTPEDYAKGEEVRQLKEQNDFLKKQNEELLRILSKARQNV